MSRNRCGAAKSTCGGMSIALVAVVVSVMLADLLFELKTGVRSFYAYPVGMALTPAGALVAVIGLFCDGKKGIAVVGLVLSFYLLVYFWGP